MIKYKLICKNCDFSFDSWFASSKEYEKLKSKNFLNCHKCNSQKVEKTLMAPQLINRNAIDNLEKKNMKLRFVGLIIVTSFFFFSCDSEACVNELNTVCN